jgi:hypothetical protein
LRLDIGQVDKLNPEQPSLFGYRTGMSLRTGGQPPRSWITWLLLVGSVLSASGLVLGLVYWLVTFDGEALVTGFRQIVTPLFSAH